MNHLCATSPGSPGYRMHTWPNQQPFFCLQRIDSIEEKMDRCSQAFATLESAAQRSPTQQQKPSDVGAVVMSLRH